MSSIKVFVSNRIDLDSVHLESDVFIPVRCGAVFDKRKGVNIQGDDDGENISDRRLTFCELTVQYWAWKNVEADFYGLCHYRRFFDLNEATTSPVVNDCNHEVADSIDQSFVSKFCLTEGHLQNLLNEYDIIKTHPMEIDSGSSVYESLSENKDVFKKKDIDSFINLVKKRFPEIECYIDDYFSSNKWQGWNLYIMKKEYFFEYSEMLFSLLFELEKIIDISNYSVEQARIFGYFAEMFFPVWLSFKQSTTNVRVKSVYAVDVKHPERLELKSTSNTDTVTVVLTASDSYVPFLSVVIQSIFENKAPTRQYELVVLGNKISRLNQQILKSSYESENFSLKFIEIEKYLNRYKFHVSGHITPMTYMRLAVLDIFKDVEKIVYLDCDLVVNTDIASLYDEDLTNCYLAAAKDTVMASWMNSEDKYRDFHTLVGQEKPFEYFNAGVLLFNLKEMRKYFTTEDLMKIATSKDWQWFDQDVLNKISVGKVKYLDNVWNFMAHDTKVVLPESLAPAELFYSYRKAERNPYIVHYAGKVIPCYCPTVSRFDLFWKYARNCPYYEEIAIISVANMISQRKKAGSIYNLIGNCFQYLKYSLLSKTCRKRRSHYLKKKEQYKARCKKFPQT